MKALAHIHNPVRSRRFFTALRAGLQKAIANKVLISAHLGEVKNPDLVSQVADFLLTYRRRRRSLCTRRFKGMLNFPPRLDRTTTNAGNILRDFFDNRGETGEHSVLAGASFEVGENGFARRVGKCRRNLNKAALQTTTLSRKGTQLLPI